MTPGAAPGISSISACLSAASSGGAGAAPWGRQLPAAAARGAGGAVMRGGSVAGRGGIGAGGAVTGSLAFGGLLVASSSAMIRRMGENLLHRGLLSLSQVESCAESPLTPAAGGLGRVMHCGPDSSAQAYRRE